MEIIKRYLLGVGDNLKFEKANDHIIVLEFPKSGITFFLKTLIDLHFILQSNKSYDISATDYNIHNFVPDLDAGHKNEGKKIFGEFKFAKTHISSFSAPRLIYLIRNPFDVLRSYHNFLNNYQGKKITLDNLVKHKSYGIKAWKQHYKDTCSNMMDKKMIILRYEKLKTGDDFIKLFKLLGVMIDPSKLELALLSQSIDKQKDLNKLYNENIPNLEFEFAGSTKATRFNNQSQELIVSESKEICEFHYGKKTFQEWIAKETNL